MIFLKNFHCSNSLVSFSSLASFLTNLYPKAWFLSVLNIILVSVLGLSTIRATEEKICSHYKGVCFNLFHLPHFINSLQLAYWLSIHVKLASNSCLICFKVASNLFQISFKFVWKIASNFRSSNFQVFCEEGILKETLALLFTREFYEIYKD